MLALGGTSLMLSMWGDHVSTALNTVYLGFGFGAALVNIFVAQFLDQDHIELSNSNSTMGNFSSSSSANIKIPYAIAAGLCILIAIGHLIFAICAHRNRRQALRMQQVNYAAVNTTPLDDAQHDNSQHLPQTHRRSQLYYSIFMCSVWVVHMFFTLSNFNEKCFVRHDTLLALVFVNVTLTVLWIGELALAITWIIYVRTIGLSINSLLVLGSFAGLGFSPALPLSFGFISQRLNITPLLVCIFLCRARIGGISFQKVAGALMDKNPKHFPTILIICVFMATLFYGFTFVLSMLHRRRSMKKALSLQSTSIIGCESTL
ncbi:unnamed protein product [Rotaria magnacalcarata]|uniref:Uncharacterized protein n=1 Tax=Rotaria magnacalcarata TaxID=392030 RepID=A0A819NNE3_9BILA|nr:unnamed protein product [Rotaria magnacalcarata]